MSAESKEVKVIGVDKEQIRMSSDKKEFWLVPFKLSSTPDESWQKKFYEVQQRDTDDMKRKSRVDEYAIRIEVSSSDNLQQVLNVLKTQVERTNVLCAEDYQRKIKIRQELEDLQQVQRDVTQKLKEDSDRLTF